MRDYAAVPTDALRDKSLSAVDLRVLGILCAHADHRNNSRPSTWTIADLLDIDKRQVKRALARLRDAGWIAENARTIREVVEYHIFRTVTGDSVVTRRGDSTVTHAAASRVTELSPRGDNVVTQSLNKKITNPPIVPPEHRGDQSASAPIGTDQRPAVEAAGAATAGHSSPQTPDPSEAPERGFEGAEALSDGSTVDPADFRRLLKALPRWPRHIRELQARRLLGVMDLDDAFRWANEQALKGVRPKEAAKEIARLRGEDQAPTDDTPRPRLPDFRARVTPSDKRLWQGAQQRIRTRFGASQFEQFFKPLCLAAVDDQTVIVEAPDERLRAFVERCYGEDILSAFRDRRASVERVEFVLASEGASHDQLQSA